MNALGIDTRHVTTAADHYTAQAMIMTDRDNNQITAFHPGAMSTAHQNPVPARSDLQLAIVAPDGRDAMITHAQQLNEAGIPFVFDPGQGLPMFNGEELLRFIDQASWVAVNDYEGRMLCDRTGLSLADISRRVKGMVVTLAEHGCDVWEAGASTRVAGVKAAQVVDPTGAAMPSGPRCCTACRKVGRWRVARNGATAWARSRLRCAARRTTP